MGEILGYPVDETPDPQPRPREWHAIFLGDLVVLRHYAILAPGEHLTEKVPEKTLTWDQWRDTHADYGLELDGTRM